MKEAYAAAKVLRQKFKTSCVKLLKLCPLDREAVISACRGADIVCIVEEGMKRGGMGEEISSILSAEKDAPKTLIIAVEGFLPHGEISDLYSLCGFEAESIVRSIWKKMQE